MICTITPISCTPIQLIHSYTLYTDNTIYFISSYILDLKDEIGLGTIHNYQHSVLNLELFVTLYVWGGGEGVAQEAVGSDTVMQAAMWGQ